MWEVATVDLHRWNLTLIRSNTFNKLLQHSIWWLLIENLNWLLASSFSMSRRHRTEWPRSPDLIVELTQFLPALGGQKNAKHYTSG